MSVLLRYIIVLLVTDLKYRNTEIQNTVVMIFVKSVEKLLSEVGFEPTPSYEDQNSPIAPYEGSKAEP